MISKALNDSEAYRKHIDSRTGSYPIELEIASILSRKMNVRSVGDIRRLLVTFDAYLANGRIVHATETLVYKKYGVNDLDILIWNQPSGKQSKRLLNEVDSLGLLKRMKLNVPNLFAYDLSKSFILTEWIRGMSLEKYMINNPKEALYLLVTFLNKMHITNRIETNSTVSFPTIGQEFSSMKEKLMYMNQGKYHDTFLSISKLIKNAYVRYPPIHMKTIEETFLRACKASSKNAEIPGMSFPKESIEELMVMCDHLEILMRGSTSCVFSRIHGDTRPDNFIVSKVGVEDQLFCLDLEYSGIGDVAFDSDFMDFFGFSPKSRINACEDAIRVVKKYYQVDPKFLERGLIHIFNQRVLELRFYLLKWIAECLTEGGPSSDTMKETTQNLMACRKAFEFIKDVSK